MTRDAFLRGVAELKAHIKKLAEVQRRDKKILRMPRKDAEQLALIDVAIAARDPEGDRYSVSHPDISWVQMTAAERRMRITAFLTIYAKVRGKEAPYKTDKYNQSMFEDRLRGAQGVFDTGVAEVDKPVEVG